jgi:hypothetical protein
MSMPTEPHWTESDVEDTIDAAALPLGRPTGVRVLRRLGQVAVAAGAIALLSLFAREGGAPKPTPPDTMSDIASGAAFVPSVPRTARPAAPLALTTPRFRLDDPDAIEPVRAETARRNPSTGQREDVLIQGGFSTIEAPYLRLILTETLDSEPVQSLFVTLARRAADGQGLAVIRTGERGVVATKFGAIETLDITLGGEGKRTCTGFASLGPGSLRLDGWLCAPLGQAPEARALVCALDKIALNGQASPEMDSAFAALDARRDPGCRTQSVSAPASVVETGSISGRRTRKNEAKLRPSREARP